MRHRINTALFVLAFSVPALARDGRPASRPVVRSQMVQSTQLAPDPRAGRTITISPGPGWMAFNQKGYLSEIGAAVNGAPAAVEHRTLDGRGRPLQITRDGASTPIRTEYKDGPFGAKEEDQFRGDQLVRKTLNKFDDRGRCISSEAFDADGNPQSAVKYKYDTQGRTTEIVTESWRPGEQEPSSYFRQDDTYDDQGNLLQHMEYGPDGEALRSLTFTPSFTISSWWQKPGTTFSQPLSVGHFDPNTQTNTNYELMPDGNLFKVIESRDTSTNTDTIQRFDGNGNLVEKVEVSYQFDQAGNWTERTVSAWDPSSNSMVAIRKDSRTLSYY